METAAKQTAPATSSKSLLMRLSIALFTIGMVATVAVFVLFAAGFSDLPLWLSAVAGVVTPLGLALGLAALVREHRHG